MPRRGAPLTRILLYTGKGGVGKTSVAAATALMSAERGNRTIVLSTDIAHSLGDAFNMRLGPEPGEIAPNLWAQEPDVYFNIGRYWQTIQTYMTELFSWRGLDTVLAEEMTVLPGMDELGNLLWIADHVESGKYDVIVVDSAPTGETLRMLSLPEASRWWVDRIAPIGRRVSRLSRPLVERMIGVPVPRDEVFASAERLLARLDLVHRLLADPERSSVRLVLALEKLALAEARRSFTYFHLFGYPSDLVVCNRVMPQSVDGYFAATRDTQRAYLSHVREDFAPVPVRTVPLFDREVDGLDGLREVGRALFGDEDPAGFLYRGRPYRVRSEKGKHILEVGRPALPQRRSRAPSRDPCHRRPLDPADRACGREVREARRGPGDDQDRVGLPPRGNQSFIGAPRRPNEAACVGAMTSPGHSGPPSDLRFSSDRQPGLRRVRAGRGFRYLAPDGRPVRDPEALARVRAIAIPPAWVDVWVCPDASGHLQAVGRDARGRKQYRYHERFRADRDRSKFARLSTFGRALPAIRRRVAHDLRRPGLTRAKVVATIVRLLDTTYLRVGNEEYARTNRSFGLTTLRNRHVVVSGTSLRFRFRGKGGRLHEVGIRDRRLASIVAKCHDLPGQELFEYLDELGEPQPIDSADVNEYLRAAAGADISAKDFRTWAGTLLAFRALRSNVEPSDPANRRSMRRSTELVAEALGNTPAVSRESYIAPMVVDAFIAGALPRGRATEGGQRGLGVAADRREELELIHLLEKTPAKGARAGRRTGRGIGVAAISTGDHRVAGSVRGSASRSPSR